MNKDFENGLDPLEGVIDGPATSEMILKELARATAEKAGDGEIPADDIYDGHFAKGGWLPVVDWETAELPASVVGLWKDALMLSGVLATGQIYMTEDGAGGITQLGLFRHAMSHLSGALAKHKPGSHVVIETKTNFVGPDGILRANATRGVTYIVGMSGCEPLRVGSGENPFMAIRRAIEKACGGFVAKQLETAKK